jgi:hypothetical protein
VKQAEAVCGKLHVALIIWDARAFPKKRNYAFCTSPDSAPEVGVPAGFCAICVAPKMLDAAADRVRGVLMHEIGHAVDFQRTPDHPHHRAERRADKIAEAIWNIPIRYDADTVQSTCCGVHPRPAHLGL